MKKSLFLLFIVFLFGGCASTTTVPETPGKEETVTAAPKETEVAVIQTNMGTIVIRFFEEDAPKHCANFKKLAREGFYDSTLFHRVMPDFMIQGGDHLSKDNNPYNDGSGNPGYTIEAEIKRYHKRGAVAAARRDNPQKRSGGSQFYIIQQGVWTESQLRRFGKHNKQMYNAEQIRIYTTVGGSPHLDGDYTVFAEVIEGMEVVDRITRVERDQRNRPLQNVVMERVVIEKRIIE